MDSVVSPVSVVPHGLPLAMDRERSRVLVAESLHRAAAAANSGSLDAACALLADAETMLAASPSMQQRDPLCARLQEVLGAALRRLEETLDECKCRSGASRLEKPSLPQLAQLGDAINPMYRYSLASFELYFHKAIGLCGPRRDGGGSAAGAGGGRTHLRRRRRRDGVVHFSVFL